MEVSYEMELMFWYQDSVESAIMIDLFTEIENALEKSETVAHVQKINDQMANDALNVLA